MKKLFVFFIVLSFSFVQVFSEDSQKSTENNKTLIENEKREEKKSSPDKNKATQETSSKSKQEKSNKESKKLENKKVVRTVIINSANNIEYSNKKNDLKESSKKDEQAAKKIDTDELITFIGNVSISIESSDNTDTIFADTLIYNKTRNTLQAEGNVTYERKISGKLSQKFEGNTIVFDIDTMSGVFLDGKIKNTSQKKNLADYMIFSNTSAHDESGTTVFKDAKLTTSSSKEPLWSINASRIWLLPGNEISFANAYYSIGIVPIFYLPFFYLPSDEMIFHPAFGYRSRVGYFVQSTSYLIGRKKLAKQDSKNTFSNFLSSDSLKKQRRNGLFLQNLNEDEKTYDTSYLKILADAYSALGFLIGLDGNFNSKIKYVNILNFNACFAFSHTLYPVTSDTNTFTMYNFKGESKFNKSNFFGKTLPFRYHFDFNASVSKAPIRLDVSFPFISDPYFKSDFFDRSEDMNWLKFILNQNVAEKKETSSSQSSYDWLLRFSANPNTRLLSPYVSFFNTDISNTVFFNSRKNEMLKAEDSLYSPERYFYYPKKLNPKVDISLRGTLFSTSLLNKKKRGNETLSISTIKNPFIENKNKENDDSKKIDSDDKTESPLFIEDFLPLYTYKNEKQNTYKKLIDYSLTYDFKTAFLHEGLWSEREWKEASNIKWKDFDSHYYKLQYTLGLNNSLSLFSDLLKINNYFELKQNYQRHPYIKDNSKKKNISINDFKDSNSILSNKNTVNLYPLYFSKMFKASSIQWSISETILKTTFDGNEQNLKYKLEKVKWNKEAITNHELSTTLALKLDRYTQSLKLSAALPPKLSSYSISSSFQHPYGSLTSDTKIFEKENARKKWFWAPFSVNANWLLPYDIKSSQSYSYNIEDKKSDSFKFSLSWKYLSIDFLMQRDFKYKLNSLNIWQIDGSEKKFQAKTFEFNFSNKSDPFKLYFWKNRIRIFLGLKSKLNINLQKVTESFFTFEPEISFSIFEFLDLKIGILSRNNVIARYFQDSLNLGRTIPGEKNILIDLAKSFYFWDENARRSSGFKVKSIHIELQHDLKDWTLQFQYSFAPEIKKNISTGRNEYNFIPKFSFVVNWNPMNDIRIKTTKKGKDFQIERGSIR